MSMTFEERGRERDFPPPPMDCSRPWPHRGSG